MAFIHLKLQEVRLPARLNNAWDHSSVCHLAEAEARELKFLQHSTRTASQLAATAKTHWRGVAWHFIESHFSGLALFIALVHIEDGRFQLLTLVPFQFHQVLASLLLCYRRFCCHYALVTFCEQDLFVSACG